MSHSSRLFVEPQSLTSVWNSIGQTDSRQMACINAHFRNSESFRVVQGNNCIRLFDFRNLINCEGIMPELSRDILDTTSNSIPIFSILHEGITDLPVTAKCAQGQKLLNTPQKEPWSSRSF